MALWKWITFTGSPVFTSFNPCFSGWRSESRNHMTSPRGKICFNPCFSGWRSERQRNGRHNGKLITVSILVFLDGALKAKRSGVVSHWRLFQSLFFWMALWKSYRLYFCVRLYLFQSLFFWMALWKQILVIMRQLYVRVSILVFLDGALKDIFHSLYLIADLVSILVFLDGALKAERVKSWPFCTFCFNPCFSGWRSESQAPDKVTITDQGFNPCFSGWRSESSTNKARNEASWMFQSLFFWMALWKRSSSTRNPP